MLKGWSRELFGHTAKEESSRDETLVFTGLKQHIYQSKGTGMGGSRI